ncbi:MAG: hypothetical protein ABIS30_00325 [Gallionella sp.]|jgi:hypothetical protein
MSIDYMVKVEPLVKPIGDGYFFVAKLAYCYESSNGSEKSIDPGIGESIGKTKEDAGEKLEAKMRAWVKEREQAQAK